MGNSIFFKKNIAKKELEFDGIYYWRIGFVERKFNPKQTDKNYTYDVNLPIDDIQEILNSYGIKTWNGDDNNL